MRYIYVGPAERTLGSFDPTGAVYLTESYALDEVTIFAVDGYGSTD